MWVGPRMRGRARRQKCMRTGVIGVAQEGDEGGETYNLDVFRSSCSEQGLDAWGSFSN